MATMALAENPSIVLRRVQDAELVELPSLPSFTPDFGDDETDDYYGANSTSTRQEENEDVRRYPAGSQKADE
jgi:hypothetical protein